MDVNQQYTKAQSWTQPKSNNDGQYDSEIPSTLIWPFIVSLLASVLLHLWCYSTSSIAVIPFPSAQLDIICIYKICPRTQQVPAVAAELLNLFAEVTRKKRQREEKKVVSIFFFFFLFVVKYDLSAHLWIESSPFLAVIIWLFGIQEKKTHSLFVS